MHPSVACVSPKTSLGGAGRCDSCLDGYDMTSAGKCLPSNCAPGTFVDNETAVCHDCKGTFGQYSDSPGGSVTR